MLKVFLHLRIKEVELQKDSEDIAPKKKFMTYKEKRKNLSRMQRKVWGGLSHALRQWIYVAICSVRSNDCTSVAIVNSWALVISICAVLEHLWDSTGYLIIFLLFSYVFFSFWCWWCLWLVVFNRKEYIQVGYLVASQGDLSSSPSRENLLCVFATSCPGWLETFYLLS